MATILNLYIFCLVSYFEMGLKNIEQLRRIFVVKYTSPAPAFLFLGQEHDGLMWSRLFLVCPKVC